MSTNACGQEMCPNWGGDGRVCPCALFDIEPEEQNRVRLIERADGVTEFRVPTGRWAETIDDF